VGLSLISIDGKVTREDGHTVVEHGDTALGARPATVGLHSPCHSCFPFPVEAAG
jgi:hypothetical protein